MYDLKITNNYKYDCLFKRESESTPSPINRGEHIFLELGNAILTVPGSGVVNFIDLANNKIKGYENYPKEYWGVLVRANNIEGYYRYEGGGQLSLEIDAYGSYTLSTQNGTLITINLPELTIK